MTSLLEIAIYIFMLNCWLMQQVTTGLTQNNLNMVYDAFDDQYEGYIQEMEEKAPQILKEELKMKKQLKSEWGKAEKHWKQIRNEINIPENFNDFHGTALVAYTGHISEDFNTAVTEFRQNACKSQYNVFHYYLTRSLQLLKEGNCHDVYRSSDTKFYYSGKGSVWLGQFTSSFLNEKVALHFLEEGGTLFKIETCLGVDIKSFSVFSRKEDVLIPGYEVYEKVTVKQTDKYTELPLKIQNN